MAIIQYGIADAGRSEVAEGHCYTLIGTHIAYA